VQPPRRDVPRFFVDGAYAVGETVPLGSGDARKVLVVLRGRTGDALEVCDSSGCAFSATLVVDGERAIARLDAVVERPSESRVEIVLAQAIPKGAKMDFVVEKATELGVARVVPLVTERTIGDGERGGKVDRWRRLARAAAQQCGRLRVPEVSNAVGWDAFLSQAARGDRLLMPWELAERVPLRDQLPAAVAGARRVVVLIGPEGGISHGEGERAAAAGAQTLSLGSRILRTETAGLVVISALLYELGEL
jgi:16S rRNA (uracil1498-N3)-methyltransferase